MKTIKDLSISSVIQFNRPLKDTDYIYEVDENVLRAYNDTLLSRR